MDLLLKGLEDAFDLLVSVLLRVHPPETLKGRIDDTARKGAELAADVAEDAKFGPSP